MAAKLTGLGRGLGALIKDATTAMPEPAAPVAAPAAALPPPGPEKIPLTQIHASPFQPRRQFDPATLDELIASIREKGVLQPVILRRAVKGYELIAGERRWRAAQAAGLEKIPAVIVEASDQDALELALVENLQRNDLNPIEEALGYRLLGEKFNLTQEQIATRLGKARASVANALRLLGLAEPVRQMLAEGRLSAGHAKVLAGVEDVKAQELLAAAIVRDGLSVRQLERAVARLSRVPRKPRAAKTELSEAYVRDLADRLRRQTGTAVRIMPHRVLANGKRVKGSLEIDFYSNDDLERILALLGVGPEAAPGGAFRI